MPSELEDRPLLRVWDYRSDIQPDYDYGGAIRARADRHPLNTASSRRVMLERYADYEGRRPTPFISFTSSPRNIETLAENMRESEGWNVQFVTVIDPKIRHSLRLPFLDASYQLYRTGILDPHGQHILQHKDDYLCLWEVTPVEIVGTWHWNELVKEKDWFEKIVMPKFRLVRSRGLNFIADAACHVKGSLETESKSDSRRETVQESKLEEEYHLELQRALHKFVLRPKDGDDGGPLDKDAWSLMTKMMLHYKHVD